MDREAGQRPARPADAGPRAVREVLASERTGCVLHQRDTSRGADRYDGVEVARLAELVHDEDGSGATALAEFLASKKFI